MKYEIGLTVEAQDFTAALLIAIRVLSRQLRAQMADDVGPMPECDAEEKRLWN